MDRATLEPGWSWSKCVKPIVNTNSYKAPHTSCIISGGTKVKMNDGPEIEGGSGHTAIIPPGHNAWIFGDKPCVSIDFPGMADFAKS
jgi:hypothetical protein